MTDTNPFREGLPRGRVPDPATIVIFGATGDLTHRKLIPALYRLHRQKLLPDTYTVVGVARREWSDEDMRRHVRDAILKSGGAEPPAEEWRSFDHHFHYVSGEFGDPAAYTALAGRLDAMEKERGGHASVRNRLYYLATPPDAFEQILKGLLDAGLVHDSGSKSPWSRVIVEKPFGHDLESARDLNALIGRTFHESQIYRIDHYLGKETVQNILVLRFGNGIFEPLWNRKYIDHVQITVAEELGVEGRAGYFEKSGILRDIVQNHVMQVLALVAMEPPVAFEGEAVRDEKVKVIRALRPIRETEVDAVAVRGQYGPGSIGGGAVPGYREEPDVAKESGTETYMALRTEIDNWRWAGVPFYLRAGKRLARRVTEVSIQFRDPPHRIFQQAGPESLASNVLALRIQPDEGISIRFGAKVPGPAVKVQPVKMDFLYGSAFGVESSDAYERLILDCLLGESTLFIRRDEVEGAWAYMQPLLNAWAARKPEGFPNYAAGSWGPEASSELLEQDGRQWRRL